MKFQKNVRALGIALFVVAGSIVLAAWAGGPRQIKPLKVGSDTIPKSERRAGDRDLDKELRDLEEARKKMEDLKDFDWTKIQRDLEEALKKIDADKIKMQTEQALAKIDMEKIGKDIEESLKKIDFNKIEKELESAINEMSKIDKDKLKADLEKARKEVQEALEKKEWRKEMDEVKKINMKEISEELEKAKKEIDKARKDLDLEKLNMKENLDKARVEIDKAREELKGYQEMIYAMEKEGLLNTKEDYSIEYKDGKIIVNGSTLSNEKTEAYRKFFKKDNTTIKKSKGDLKIDID